jgi:5,5'-dehydrodivanillate O-demethylase
LHQDTALDVLGAGKQATNTTRGFTDNVASFEFYEFPYGIMKKRIYKNGMVDEHPLVFPNILRQANATQIRVPIDDTHTRIFFVRFYPGKNGGVGEHEEDPEVEYAKPYKIPPDALHPFTKYTMHETQAQDHMAWETQGPIADRTRERLATTDRGVIMLREIMKREMARVQQGLDPKGVIRDPNHEMIDTNVMESIKQMSRSRSPEARATA